MKLKLASDLHIEFHSKNDIPDLGTGDVLVLAGDIISSKYLIKNGENKEKAFDFFQQCSRNFTHIIYIEGNHSFYGCRYENVFDDVRRILPSNFIHLENDKIKIENYWFVGAVLWTDFDNENPFAMLNASRMMNDYHCIKYGPSYRKITSYDVLKHHKETMRYFEETLEELQDEKVIMITHHTPSSRSIQEKYKFDDANSYFNNRLDDWIYERPQIKYWLCGHTHWQHSYQIGTCEVICNPLGYPGENTGFNPNLEILIS